MIATQVVSASQNAIVFLAPVNIGAPGFTIPVHWALATGATKAELTQASVTLLPGVVEETHTDVPSHKDGSGWIIDIPAKKRLKALTFTGFKQADGTDLTSSLPGGMRLAVAFPPVKGGGFDSPRFSAPAVNRTGSVPAQLTGASYSNGVLQLNPAVDAAKVRISLVTGDNPLEFAEQDINLDTVHATTQTPAVNAKVNGPDGSPIWQTPVFDPDGPSTTVDLQKAIEAALNKQLAAKAAPSVDVVVTADAPAQAVVNVSGPRGALLRVEQGKVRTVLEGDPVTIQLSGPLDNETPASVTGDLTIRYSGIRILEGISDNPPGPTDALAGAIVDATGIVRALPPQALDGLMPARLGVYGRAPEDCELAIEFVRQVGPAGAEPLVSPAVLSLKASSTFQTQWAQVPAGTKISGAAAVRVHANRGRFFWVTNAAGDGLVRIAIFDPSPGGRPVLLGGATLATLPDATSDRKQFAFPVVAFRNAAPQFTSNLFLVVDCSDLTLRYAR
jgi:hypothetical protein